MNPEEDPDADSPALERLNQRAIGAYLGLALGDALGATVEFMTPHEIRVTHGTHDRIQGGGWLHLPPGHVTDDTTMSLALGRSILECRAVETRGAAEAFSDWMRGKPVDIGNTVRRGIIHYRMTGGAWEESNESAAGNGACMRCLPVALATYGLDDNAVELASRAQAHITHHNLLSDAAALCIIRMVHAALDGKSLDDMKKTLVARLVDQYPLFNYQRFRIDNPSGYIVETMQAVFQALFSTTTFRECLVDVVNRGGDADTTGAIAGMIAGCVYGVDSLPDSWLSRLDSQVSQDCTQQAFALIELSLERKGDVPSI